MNRIERRGYPRRRAPAVRALGQAHGLAFSVKPGVKPPPSLVNIYKELDADLGCPAPPTGCLIPWAQQGVMLLNAVLLGPRPRAD